MHTHQNAAIRYQSSAMTLNVHSNALYLWEPAGKSWSAGFFFMGNHNRQAENVPNDSMHVECKILKNVVASAAEAKLAALYKNCTTVTILRTALHEMGFPQSKTPVCSDNETASEIINKTVHQKRTQAMTMQYFWLKEKHTTKQFQIYWKP